MSGYAFSASLIILSAALPGRSTYLKMLCGKLGLQMRERAFDVVEDMLIR